MKKDISAGLVLTSTTWVIGLLFLVSCATLPPYQPAKDLKQIAGVWEGWSNCGQRTVDVTFTFQENGTWEASVDPPSPHAHTVGTIRVANGKYHGKSETTGRTGTFTLHEGEGKKVLVLSGECTGRYTPSS